MKTLITLTAFMLITAFSFAQQKTAKDTTAVPDSVAIVSIADIKSALQYIEDKVTKKEYDQFERAYILLLQMNEQKRKKTITKSK